MDETLTGGYMKYQRRMTQQLIDEIEGKSESDFQLKDLHLSRCTILDHESEYEIQQDLRAEYNFDDEVLDMLSGVGHAD